MNSNLKSTFVPQSNQPSTDSDSAGLVKAPAFRVETGIRAGWVPGSNVREALRNMRGSVDQSAEIR